MLAGCIVGSSKSRKKRLMTNGGETNVKDIFKHSMGKGKDEILKNGAGTDDVKGVVKANKAKGIRVGFQWRKMIGVIDKAGSFNVESLRTRVLSREDRQIERRGTTKCMQR